MNDRHAPVEYDMAAISHKATHEEVIQLLVVLYIPQIERQELKQSEDVAVVPSQEDNDVDIRKAVQQEEDEENQRKVLFTSHRSNSLSPRQL